MTPETLAQIHATAFSATRPWSAAEFADLLKQPGMILIGDSRAFALVRVTLDEAEVLTLATDPAHRRQGLARQALQNAEDAAQKAGANHIFLEVAENNDAATTLYTHASYRQVGRRPGYYLSKDAAPVAALVLRKQLIGIYPWSDTK